MSTILNYIPKNAEVGVGLALLDQNQEFIFFLPGRHRLGSAEIFYAGIGGHLEKDEDLLTCGRREAREEIGVEILYEDSFFEPVYIPVNRNIRTIEIKDDIKPVGIFEMTHPEGSPRAGNVYHIVIFQARLRSFIRDIKLDGVSGIITMSKDQVKKGISRKVTIQKLMDEGSRLFLPEDTIIDREISVYPIGTAEASIMSKQTQRRR
ncbi:NUDIX hydrolase [Paenibacillus alkalitolerans]|uniref:NUDIX hydrolase n=1 Tax=Paenibacillus alkalitolerans TaxID=2799335 RepID=UPI0018F38E83|nr:NUDIX hydrolase [Paenibacillus alkalitolerans]